MYNLNKERSADAPTPANLGLLSNTYSKPFQKFRNYYLNRKQRYENRTFVSTSFVPKNT